MLYISFLEASDIPIKLLYEYRKIRAQDIEDIVDEAIQLLQTQSLCAIADGYISFHDEVYNILSAYIRHEYFEKSQTKPDDDDTDKVIAHQKACQEAMILAFKNYWREIELSDAHMHESLIVYGLNLMQNIEKAYGAPNIILFVFIIHRLSLYPISLVYKLFIYYHFINVFGGEAPPRYFDGIIKAEIDK